MIPINYGRITLWKDLFSSWKFEIVSGRHGFLAKVNFNSNDDTKISFDLQESSGFEYIWI